MPSLSLPWPPSNNTYWRHVGARVLLSQRGREYRVLVGQQVLVQWPRGIPRPMSGRLSLTIVTFQPDKRVRDLDNLPKAVQDALQHAGVFEDDGQIDTLHVFRGPSERPGALQVTIRVCR